MAKMAKISKMNFGENTHRRLNVSEEMYLSKDVLMFASLV
jgi:hypothetical protein